MILLDSNFNVSSDDKCSMECDNSVNSLKLKSKNFKLFNNPMLCGNSVNPLWDIFNIVKFGNGNSNLGPTPNLLCDK